MEHPAIIDNLRLIGIPGTNKVMAGEFSRLTRRAFDDVKLPQPAKEGQGAVVFPFEPRLAALAVTYHRTSSRVLWGLYSSGADRLEPLYDDLYGAVRRDDRKWLWDGARISVDVSNTQNFKAGGRQLVGVVKNAIVSGFSGSGVNVTVDPDNPQVVVDVRMHDDKVVVSLDLAGRPMNQRGYRTGRGLAPLRENLAAVVVMLARYDSRAELLLDPMAGSGTIAIEAALMAHGAPVWTPPRQPLATSHPVFAEHLKGMGTDLFRGAEPAIIAADADTEIRPIAEANIDRAGAIDDVELWTEDFRRIEPDTVFARAEAAGLPTDRGLIVTNPPYGERLVPRELNEMYEELGSWCRRFKGWRAAFIVANLDFERAFGGRPRIKKPLSNGPLKGYFLQYDL